MKISVYSLGINAIFLVYVAGRYNGNTFEYKRCYIASFYHTSNANSYIKVNKETSQIRLSYELCHHSLLYICYDKN